MSPATQQEITASKVKLVGLVVLGGILGIADVVLLMCAGVPA